MPTTPRLWTSDLHNWGRIHFCCLKPSSWWSFGSPQKPVLLMGWNTPPQGTPSAHCSRPPSSTLKSPLSLGMQPAPVSPVPPALPSPCSQLPSDCFPWPLRGQSVLSCCWRRTLLLLMVQHLFAFFWLWCLGFPFRGGGGEVATLPQFPTHEVCMESMTHDPRLVSQSIPSSGH